MSYTSPVSASQCVNATPRTLQQGRPLPPLLAAPPPPAASRSARQIATSGTAPARPTAAAAVRRRRPVRLAAQPPGVQPAAAAASTAAAEEQALTAAADLPLLLGGVRVVLVAPKTPANIGAVLRLAENFEAHDVLVVAPRCDPHCDEVAVTSCSSAVLESMRVVPSLAEALADCTGSIGFTRRAGAGRLVHASLHQLLDRFPGAVPALSQPLPQRQGGVSAEAAAAAAAGGGRVALVFGREESGLLECELLLCSHACAIPTGRSQPSLNLSHAVAVVASQLFDIQQQRFLRLEQQQEQPQQQQQAGSREAGGHEPSPSSSDNGWQDCPPALPEGVRGLRGSLFESEKARWQRDQILTGASHAELEALLSRTVALLEAAGISAQESVGGGDKSNHGRRRLLMGHVRSLLLRGQASTAEVRALHGLLRELEGRLKGATAGRGSRPRR